MRTEAAHMTATRSPTVAWLLVAFYCLLIFIQSAFPTPGGFPGIPGLDKLAHLLIYLLLSLLFGRAYRLSFSKMTVPTLFLLAWLCTALYGASDEFHQAFVAARSADILDWLADVTGGALGAGLHLWLVKRRASGV
jgi:VanZ family protein